MLRRLTRTPSRYSLPRDMPSGMGPSDGSQPGPSVPYQPYDMNNGAVPSNPTQDPNALQAPMSHSSFTGGAMYGGPIQDPNSDPNALGQPVSHASFVGGAPDPNLLGSDSPSGADPGAMQGYGAPVGNPQPPPPSGQPPPTSTPAPQPTPTGTPTRFAPATFPNTPNRSSYNASRVPYSSSMQQSDFYGTQGPYNQSIDNRNNAIDTGRDLDQQFSGDSNFYGGLEDYYRGGADTAYNDLNGTPGWTNDESNNINREAQFNSGVANSGDYANLGPTGSEAQGIRGDPNSLYNFFSPAEQARQRSINSDVRTNQLGDIGQATDAMGHATDRESGSYDAALNPALLSQSSGVQGRLNGILDRNRLTQSADIPGKLNGILDRNRLTQSQDFVNKYRMTPGQQQDLVNDASSTVGYGTQAQKEEIARRAAASGNANPLGIAAAEDDANRTGLAASGDAVTRARIAASHEAAGREKDIEGMRLDAEGNYAGMATNATLASEGQRLGAEGNYAGLAANTNLASEGQRLGAEQYQAGQRVAGAARIGSAQRDTAGYGGTARTGVEGNYGTQQGGTERYLTNTGTDIAGRVNDLNTTAANTLYNNRRNLGQYQINNRFNQNFQTQGQLSNTNQAGAAARMSGQQQYRNYLTGSRDTALGARQNAGAQRISAFGTAGNLMQGATNSGGSYVLNRAALPTTGDKVAGAIGGALRSI